MTIKCYFINKAFLTKKKIIFCDDIYMTTQTVTESYVLLQKICDACFNDNLFYVKTTYFVTKFMTNFFTILKCFMTKIITILFFLV